MISAVRCLLFGLLVACFCGAGLFAQAVPQAPLLGLTNAPLLIPSPPPGSSIYRLAHNDVIEVAVYQEEDMRAKLRIAKDGSATYWLLGKVQLGDKTPEAAANYIRDLLAKDYLTNPQVTITVAEYGKRWFTVLGQVQKPGTYEMPNEESVSLLQAIGIAGGFNRIARQTKIKVVRQIGEKREIFILDAKAMAGDNNSQPFQILPGDSITVDEGII